jgi:hypothetical protein
MVPGRKKAPDKIQGLIVKNGLPPENRPQAQFSSIRTLPSAPESHRLSLGF